MNSAQIDAVVAEAKGMDPLSKMNHYAIAATHWHRSDTVPQDIVAQFCAALMDIATELYKWDETPPVWYHGGPAGLSAGDELLSWPRVPSIRRTGAENLRASLGLVPVRENWAYFTFRRTLALTYCTRHSDGRIYRVQPEGEIELDPHVFFVAGIAQRDPELNADFNLMVLTILEAFPAFRARTVRVLGAG